MIKNNQENPPTRGDDANARGNRQTDKRPPGMIDRENPLDMEPDDMDTGDMDTGDMDPDDMGECQYTDQELNDEIRQLGIEVPGDLTTTRLNIESDGTTIDGTVISDIDKLLRQVSGQMEGAAGEYLGCSYPLVIDPKNNLSRTQEEIINFATLSFNINKGN